MVKRLELRVGCCGFPVGLAQYAIDFEVAEVQQTFYQPPMLKTLQKWRGQVPENFEFTLKAWQLITHQANSPTYRRLRENLGDRQRREAGAFRINATVMAAWQRTLECAQALGSRVILFQCPASFLPTPENKANLRAFFHEVRRANGSGRTTNWLTCVWEPRGKWQAVEIQEVCEELGLVHGVDPFQQPPMTKRLGYFRLHGRAGYRYRYTDADLGELLEMAMRREPCYVLFNNMTMLEDARRFQRLASGQSDYSARLK